MLQLAHDLADGATVGVDAATVARGGIAISALLQAMKGKGSKGGNDARKAASLMSPLDVTEVTPRSPPSSSTRSQKAKQNQRAVKSKPKEGGGYKRPFNRITVLRPPRSGISGWQVTTWGTPPR